MSSTTLAMIILYVRPFSKFSDIDWGLIYWNKLKNTLQLYSYVSMKFRHRYTNRKSCIWRWRQRSRRCSPCQGMPKTVRKPPEIMEEAWDRCFLRILKGHQPGWHTNLRLLVPRSLRQYISAFKPSSSWYFVTVALVN